MHDNTGETKSILPRKHMSEAFRKHALKCTMVAVLIAIVAYSATAAILLDYVTEDAVAGQAHMAAASLRWADQGDLGPAVNKLLLDVPQLEGVATISSDGMINVVYPRAKRFHQAVTETVNAADDVATTGISGTKSNNKLVGVVVPINEFENGNGPKYVMLFGVTSVFWTAALWLGVASAIAFVAALCSWSHLINWFHAKVSRPLATLAPTAASEVERPSDRVPAMKTGGWYELENIADAFRGMRRDLVQSNVRRRSAQRMVKTRIKDEASGMARKLRRAEDTALTDSLTGLRNRTFLDRELENIFQESRRRREDCAAIMIDLDNFKGHNDSYGHAAGDEILAFVGQLLSGAVREDDYAIRYGGDEFLLLLSQATADQAENVANRLLKLFLQFKCSLEVDCGITLSAGVASIGSVNARSGADLLQKADESLYRAKSAGKSHVEA
ncbi:MAG: GGDEF domain-containing protein [Planctomycetota bacterium]|jgi:diguanylate cyclase (GGDEF)-like protein